MPPTSISTCMHLHQLVCIYIYSGEVYSMSGRYGRSIVLDFQDASQGLVVV